MTNLLRNAEAVPVWNISNGWVSGERYTSWFYVLGSEFLVLTSPVLAGVTSLPISPLRFPIASGSKIHFPSSYITLKTTANAVAGAVTISVVASPAPLSAGSIGHKVVDPSTFTLSWVFTKPDNTVLLTVVPTLINDPSDSDGTPIKIAQGVILPADSTALIPGVYTHKFRRTDSPNEKTLVWGEARLKSRLQI